MLISIMKNKIYSVLRLILPLFFWIGAWQIASMLIGHKFLLPSVNDTAVALFELLFEVEFYLVTFLSIFRVIIGLILGSLIGIILAFTSYKVPTINNILSPLFSVVKSTPIASIIIILYIMLSGNTLTVFVAVLMVTPIVWQNVLDSFTSIPRDLIEVCDAYQVSSLVRLRILVLPSVMKYFIPALITASGLCWKASISAEIIAYTSRSLGQYINDASNNLDTPTVFACTVVVIIFSIILEKLTKYLLRRCENWL